jgi:hypothetical protein
VELISYILKAALVLYLLWAVVLVALPNQVLRFYRAVDRRLTWNPYRRMLQWPDYSLRIRHSGLILLSPWLLAICLVFLLRAVYNATH